MLNSVEKFRKVNVNAKLMALPDDLLNPLRGSLGGSTGAKTEARFGKLRIENRCQDLADGLLNESIILPKGYTKTRRFGSYWNGHRDRYLAESRALLESAGVVAVPSEAPVPCLIPPACDASSLTPLASATPCCPDCTAKMRWIGFERKESWRIIMHSGLRPHWYRDD